jgi:hypothetical protein
MTRHLTPVRHALDNLTTAAARLPATLRNLDACAPGFPATTPGNGSPGGSVGGNGSRTETLAMRDASRDNAVTDYDALDKLVKRIAADTAVLSAITDRWGWAQAGEVDHSAAPRYAGQVPTTDVRWCVSCARREHSTAVHRGDLCRWCYEFKLAEGVVPPLEILAARHECRRITATMVREALRPKVAGRKGKR